MTTESGRSIKAVGKSLEILETLERFGGGGVSEVAAAVDLHPSTVHAHLRSLVDNGFVIKQGTTYRPSFRLLEFGGRLRQATPLYSHGWREVQAMARETGEMSNLAVEEDGQIVVLYMAEGEKSVQKRTAVGKRNPMYCTGLGKALLAELPRERVERIVEMSSLEAHTPETITDPEALFEELESIRERGYAIDDEELHEGIQCLATTVRVDGTPIGAISLTGPKERFADGANRERFAQQLLETRNVIEVNLRFSP
jgi:DNA-binding IclR family transcriptional regulator